MDLPTLLVVGGLVWLLWAYANRDKSDEAINLDDKPHDKQPAKLDRDPFLLSSMFVNKRRRTKRRRKSQP